MTSLEHNFWVKLSILVTRNLNEFGRSIFVSKWNTKYPTYKWDSIGDDVTRGDLCWNGSPDGVIPSFTLKQPIRDIQKATVLAGDISKWDISLMQQVLVFSNHFNAKDLKVMSLADREAFKGIVMELRNRMGHFPDTRITEANFLMAVTALKDFSNHFFGVGVKDREIDDTITSTSILCTDTQKLLVDALLTLQPPPPNPEESLLRLLSPTKFVNEQNTKLARFQDGSRKWLLAKVELWRHDTTHPILWLQAEAGMGKSSFAMHLSERLAAEGCLLGAIYFQFNNKDKCSPCAMVKTLAYQLAMNLPDTDIVDNIIKTSQELCLPQNEHDVQTLFSDLIAKALCSLAHPPRDMVLVVDGLDEARDSNFPTLVETLLEATHLLPPWVKLFVTSRSDTFNKVLPRHKTVCMAVTMKSSDCEHIDDLKLFIRAKLNEANTVEDVESIVNILIEKSDSKFIYFHNFSHTEWTLNMDSVRSLPAGMNAMFEVEISRILKQHYDNKVQRFQEKCGGLLAVMIAAIGPCSPHLLSIATGMSLDDVHYFTAHLGCIFPKVRSGDDVFFEPFHKSIVDWLTTRTLSGPYYVDSVEGHDLLATSLITYVIEGSESEAESTTAYAFEHLVSHLDAAGRTAESFVVLGTLAYLQGVIRVLGTSRLITLLHSRRGLTYNRRRVPHCYSGHTLVNKLFKMLQLVRGGLGGACDNTDRELCTQILRHFASGIADENIIDEEEEENTACLLRDVRAWVVSHGAFVFRTGVSGSNGGGDKLWEHTETLIRLHDPLVRVCSYDINVVICGSLTKVTLWNTLCGESQLLYSCTDESVVDIGVLAEGRILVLTDRSLRVFRQVKSTEDNVNSAVPSAFECDILFDCNSDEKEREKDGEAIARHQRLCGRGSLQLNSMRELCMLSPTSGTTVENSLAPVFMTVCCTRSRDVALHIWFERGNLWLWRRICFIEPSCNHSYICPPSHGWYLVPGGKIVNCRHKIILQYSDGNGDEEVETSLFLSSLGSLLLYSTSCCWNPTNKWQYLPEEMNQTFSEIDEDEFCFDDIDEFCLDDVEELSIIPSSADCGELEIYGGMHMMALGSVVVWGVQYTKMWYGQEVTNYKIYKFKTFDDFVKNIDYKQLDVPVTSTSRYEIDVQIGVDVQIRASTLNNGTLVLSIGNIKDLLVIDRHFTRWDMVSNGHSGPIVDVSVVLGDHVVTASLDGTCLMLDLPSMVPALPCPHADMECRSNAHEIALIALLPLKNKLCSVVTSTVGGFLRIWSLQTGRCDQTINLADHYDGELNGVLPLGEGSFVVAMSTCVRIWGPVGEEGIYECILGIVGDDYEGRDDVEYVAVYNKTCDILRHNDDIAALGEKTLREGVGFLATVSSACLRIWDPLTGELLQLYRLRHEKELVRFLRIVPDGRVVMCQGYSNLDIWDPCTAKCQKVRRKKWGRTLNIQGVAVCPVTGRVLIATTKKFVVKTEDDVCYEIWSDKPNAVKQLEFEEVMPTTLEGYLEGIVSFEYNFTAECFRHRTSVTDRRHNKKTVVWADNRCRFGAESYTNDLPSEMLSPYPFLYDGVVARYHESHDGLVVVVATRGGDIHICVKEGGDYDVNHLATLLLPVYYAHGERE